MFDFGIESVTRYNEIAFYGPLWLVEFRDWSSVIVIADPIDSPERNFVMEEESL